MSADHLPDDVMLSRLELLQADLDDESPEIIGEVLQAVLEAGALDASCLTTLRKKNRPGHRLEVLVRPEDRDRLVALLLAETSTLGVRSVPVERFALARREETVEILGHSVRIKIALWNGRPLKAKPEFDDCLRVAEQTRRPVRDIMALANGRILALLEQHAPHGKHERTDR